MSPLFEHCVNHALLKWFKKPAPTVPRRQTRRWHLLGQLVVDANPEHAFISKMRLIMTLFIWGLAFVGGVFRLRRGYRDASYVLLAVVPFPLLLVQTYGGEMLLRIYFFTLPAMVFFRRRSLLQCTCKEYVVVDEDRVSTGFLCARRGQSTCQENISVDEGDGGSRKCGVTWRLSVHTLRQ